jgi:hypothetical protein
MYNMMQIILVQFRAGSTAKTGIWNRNAAYLGSSFCDYWTAVLAAPCVFAVPYGDGDADFLCHLVGAAEQFCD